MSSGGAHFKTGLFKGMKEIKNYLQELGHSFCLTQNPYFLKNETANILASPTWG